MGRLRATLNREKLFTGDVSHELRTPLMVLASACEPNGYRFTVTLSPAIHETGGQARELPAA